VPDDEDHGVEVYDIVAAQRFVVVDSAGRPRIVLGLQEHDEVPFIRLTRTDGTDALTMHCEDDGRTLVMLNDSQDSLRASIRVNETGDSDFVLFGGDGDSKVELSVVDDAGDLRLFNELGGGWSYGPEIGVPPGGRASRPPASIEPA
jgi:hypothetical protein